MSVETDDTSEAKLKKLCFVVMGFGNKTDYPTGRTLDLNATYEAIIEPAVEAAGLECVRADKVMESGVIDAPMYEMLLRADLVIADLSTDNINAAYELGVRHALRPYSTIVMKEEEGQLHFDLNHVKTFRYQHLGSDIGSREARRAVRVLQTMIQSVMAAPKNDSPVYTFLPRLRQPQLSDAEFADLVEETKTAGEDLSALVSDGKKAMTESRFIDAEKAFAAAYHKRPDEAYVVQQLALAAYKSEHPSKLSALIRATGIIEDLKPSESTDPETLGIAGAIQKNVFLVAQDRPALDKAIEFYGRGFTIRRDYYNGENLARCLDERAAVQTDEQEAAFDRLAASKVRKVVLALLSELILSEEFADRHDRRWVFATLANCSFAIGQLVRGDEFEERFRAEKPAAWEIATFEAGKTAAISIAAHKKAE